MQRDIARPERSPGPGGAAPTWEVQPGPVFVPKAPGPRQSECGGLVLLPAAGFPSALPNGAVWCEEREPRWSWRDSEELPVLEGRLVQGLTSFFLSFFSLMIAASARSTALCHFPGKLQKQSPCSAASILRYPR